MKNAAGRIVSKKKHAAGKGALKYLHAKGYVAVPGTFGCQKNSGKPPNEKKPKVKKIPKAKPVPKPKKTTENSTVDVAVADDQKNSTVTPLSDDSK